MPASLKILLTAAECAPFAKTGGLGDVAGALPGYLNKLGHDTRVVLPMYSFIDSKKYNIKTEIMDMSVQMGYENIICNVHEDFFK